MRTGTDTCASRTTRTAPTARLPSRTGAHKEIARLPASSTTARVRSESGGGPARRENDGPPRNERPVAVRDLDRETAPVGDLV